jgi:hypothetical protein
MECGLDSSGLGQKLVVGFCEDDNELSGSIKCWEFLERVERQLASSLLYQDTGLISHL